MIRLNLGSGAFLKPGFINVDSEFTLEQLKSKKGMFRKAIVPKGAKFIRGDVRKLPFKDNYADYILATHVIEHINIEDIQATMNEWFRVLKPGGRIVITAPDFDYLVKMWQNYIIDKEPNQEEYVELTRGFYGLQITAGEHHRTPITARFMGWILSGAGFRKWIVRQFPHRHKMYQKYPGLKFRKGDVFRFGEVQFDAKKPYGKNRSGTSGSKKSAKPTRRKS
jgi:predicted SAM-dependent methyltransferase